jgi:hypothetical protein
VTDIGFKVGYLNILETGFSLRTGSIFSSQVILNVNENFSLGYAYDTYSNNQLSGLSLKAHEFAIRFKFGSLTEATAIEDEAAED